MRFDPVLVIVGIGVVVMLGALFMLLKGWQP
jgi:hypothetical protein